MLDGAGIRLGAVVSDIYGTTSQAIIRSLLRSENPEVILSAIKGRLKGKIEDLRKVLSQPLPATHSFLLQQIMDHIEYMEKNRVTLDKQIHEAMKPYQDYWDILQTIPGIDLWSAASLIAECGVDMKCFGNEAQFCSWTGMCPGNNESAGKKKSGRIRKGNNFLRTTLYEIANAAIKTKSQFKDKYKALVIRRGHKRSVIAIGHKLLRVIYDLFTRKKPYQDPGINYKKLTVQKNASRWLKALEKYGFPVEKTRPRVLKKDLAPA